MPEILGHDTDFLSQRSETERARAVALRLLAARPRTVAEMRDRLLLRFGADAAERALARLQDEGLLNDASFARQWRDSRERRRPRSPGMIERELKKRGVAADIISEAMEGYDPDDAAHRAAIRYASRQPVNDRAAFDRRVGAYLGRRGFNPGVIRRTLENLREELGVSKANGQELDLESP